MPKDPSIHKILLIGSGPIVIGQGCEFDYSGVQACKALREEGYEVVLVNSNPATIMTDPEFAHRTYIEPITPEIVEKIIIKEKPDALLPTLGGQTALNTAMSLHRAGILEKHNVRMIGAKADAIEKGEDRLLFKNAMLKIGLDLPQSGVAHTVEEGRKIAEEIGTLPLITEEAGVNSIVIAGTDDFAGMCANLAFSLSLYSGQMCTAPQDIFVPKDGIATDQGHKSFDEVATGIAAAIDALLAEPARAAGVCGAIANPATLARVEAARGLGRIVRDSAPTGEGRSATPLLLAVDAADEAAYGEERFGPIAFLVAVEDALDGIARAARLARRKGAITAGLYDTDEARILEAAHAFARAGVNLSVNLTGAIYVNQSAAFSDYHVTGLNPAGNASLTDAAFVTGRFAWAMWRRPLAA